MIGDRLDALEARVSFLEGRSAIRELVRPLSKIPMKRGLIGYVGVIAGIASIITLVLKVVGR